MKHKCHIVVLFLLLTACHSRLDLAPVAEAPYREVLRKPKQHMVLSGESIHNIAFRYDVDYQQLADSNNLSYPYNLKTGQIITVKPRIMMPKKQFNKKVLPVVKNNVKVNDERVKLKTSENIIKKTPVKPLNNRLKPTKTAKPGWLWPATGKVTNVFLPEKGEKGLNIAGNKGDKIFAAADGIVAYAGEGLQGYGNLIILKHKDQFLTAYGNNSKIIAKEGEIIKAGQVIAEMGIIGRKCCGVHFEIRKAGKPVNPFDFLGAVSDLK